ncbi:MAG: hypothetical protein RLZZ28_953 [Bacteroidota bacterium]|jgi:hypothetical protein
MKYTLILLSFFSLSLGCKTKEKEKSFDTVTYEKVKENLADKEKDNPVNFLSVESRDRKNLFGQTVVKGNIFNKATLCTYKDIEIKLSFFSKTGVKLDEGIETIYETIAPGKSTKFKTKYFAPKGTDSVAIRILKATSDLPASAK